MRILVPLSFSRDAAGARVTDGDLRAAVGRAERGLIDARLGLCLIKQRVPRQGRGRSGGFRTILAYEHGALAIFLHLFAKNAKANLSKSETEEYRALAGYLMNLGEEALAQLASERAWRRIDDERPEQNLSQ